jgi:hypothetical protein
MKTRIFFWLVFFVVGSVIFGAIAQIAHAGSPGQLQKARQSVNNQLAAPTPIPTLSPSDSITATDETRELPPVGRNAGLVLGASLLVLIIIGGVVFNSRRKPKH